MLEKKIGDIFSPQKNKITTFIKEKPHILSPLLVDNFTDKKII